ncbi:MAG: hypothetical protein EAZ97_02150 [Bacteroidetes bacterium]|nr:MAG: hypothetical protein EAZ97_02150 [Bacteroidota bacterium]
MLFQTERDVETKFLQNLFNETLNYPNSCLNWDYPVKMTLGREKRTKKADLVALHEKYKKPLIVVEAKKPTETLQAGIDQVDSYAFALQTPFSLITNGKTLILRGYYSSNTRINILETSVEELKKTNWLALKKLISYADVLSAIIEKPNIPAQPNQEQIKDFRRFFRTIHNFIRDGDKLDPSAAFDELSKVLFLKFAEEEWLKQNKNANMLSIEKISEYEMLGKGVGYVNDWFEKAVKEFYPEVFESNTKINLKVNTLKSVLQKMQNFTLKNGDVDIKGRAFEEFLPTQLRGKGLGQYFTPRPVVNFMVSLAEISIYDVIVDFACGSGGFLIKAFDEMQFLTEKLPSGMWQRLGVKKEDFLEEIKSNQIYGIDAEPRAARTAKINMMMWGDGKRIVRGNALSFKDSEEKEYQPNEYDKNKVNSGCTIILANPPFGSKETENEILNRYVLGSKLSQRKTQRTEILFLEKGIKLLRPEGKMLIVLPLGILSNESYQYVRDYLHSEAEIRAVIELPTHTFVQSGVPTIKTCVLYVQKYTAEKAEIYSKETNGMKPEEVRNFLKNSEEFNYPIFMGTAEFVGFEPSGRSILRENEQTDLDLLLADFRQQSQISNPKMNLLDFASIHYEDKSGTRVDDNNVRGSDRNLKTSFVVDFKDLESRIDPKYYFFRYHAQSLLNKFAELGKQVKEVSERFLPNGDEELDKEYPILSVTNNEGVIFNEFRKGEEFTQPYKKVSAGDIAYNPYRVNVGSIGVVPPELAGGLVSPAYVVFKSLVYEPDFLVELIKSPFYKMFIDVISTGSIRDSLSFDLLKTIKVPTIDKAKQKELYEAIIQNREEINGLTNNIDTKRSFVVEQLHELIKSK